MASPHEVIHLSDAFDITRFIAEEAVERHFNDLPEAVITIARQCLLDTTGTSIAGAEEDFVQSLRDEMNTQGGVPEASVFGSTMALPALSAALVNGTAAHALDYDDVNFHMSAHPSVAIFPALWALAERLDCTWEDVAVAYVAGHEAGCRIGRLLAPSHYAMGFHGTATIGTFAAAVACARLLDLDIDRTVGAIGIAATQAAGIRAMFGTACKPLHAGKAAQNGLFSAIMAARNFTSHPQAITAPAGFAVTHSHDLNLADALEAEPKDGYYLHDILFKYHASCYLTHAVADATANLLRESGASANDVNWLEMTVSPELDTVCNIASPQDGLQLKFSAAGIAALTLVGKDTGKLSTFSADVATDPAFTEQLRKVKVRFGPALEKTVAHIRIRLQDGRELNGYSDSGQPTSDLKWQEQRLLTKFKGLVSDTAGESRAAQMLELYQGLQRNTRMSTWMRAAAGRE